MFFTFLGKTVIHKAKFGEGVILSQDDKGYLIVKFASGEKKFAAPACFKSYLQLVDFEAARQADEENRKEIERAIDEIIKYDFRNIYKKIKISVQDEENKDESNENSA